MPFYAKVNAVIPTYNIPTPTETLPCIAVTGSAVTNRFHSFAFGFCINDNAAHYHILSL
jgi:hypothetical protein